MFTGIAWKLGGGGRTWTCQTGMKYKLNISLNRFKGIIKYSAIGNWQCAVILDMTLLLRCACLVWFVQELREAVLLPMHLPHLFVGIRRPQCNMLFYGDPGTGKAVLSIYFSNICCFKSLWPFISLKIWRITIKKACGGGTIIVSNCFVVVSWQLP